ncbi:hypothetical protein D3C85_943840 [compost metagenome]
MVVHVRVSPKNEASPNGSNRIGKASGVVPFKAEVASKGEFPNIEASMYKM